MKTNENIKIRTKRGEDRENNINSKISSSRPLLFLSRSWSCSLSLSRLIKLDKLESNNRGNMSLFYFLFFNLMGLLRAPSLPESVWQGKNIIPLSGIEKQIKNRKIRTKRERETARERSRLKETFCQRNKEKTRESKTERQILPTKQRET